VVLHIEDNEISTRRLLRKELCQSLQMQTTPR
jgi:hypothetical protein